MPRHRGPNLISSRPIRTIEPRRHSARGRFSFAQRGDLQEQRFRRDIRMVEARDPEEGRQAGVREEGELRVSSASFAGWSLNGWVEGPGRFLAAVSIATSRLIL